MFCLNDDQKLIEAFISEAPIFKLYMPFTALEDGWILRFFEVESQGDEDLCAKVNLLTQTKAFSTWSESEPLLQLISRKNYVVKFKLESELLHKV